MDGNGFLQDCSSAAGQLRAKGHGSWLNRNVGELPEREAVDEVEGSEVLLDTHFCHLFQGAAAGTAACATDKAASIRE